MSTVRWTLTDQSNGESWRMPANPNSMSPLPVGRDLSVAADGMFETAAPASQIQWDGVIVNQAHYDALNEWAHRGLVTVTDHLQRVFEVLIESFRPDPKPGRRPGARQRYTMTALFLRRLA